MKGFKPSAISENQRKQGFPAAIFLEKQNIPRNEDLIIPKKQNTNSKDKKEQTGPYIGYAKRKLPETRVSNNAKSLKWRRGKMIRFSAS